MNPDPDRKQAATDALREALNARGQQAREQLEARLTEAVQEAVAALTEPPDLPDDLFAPPQASGADDTLPTLRNSIDRLATGEDQVAILNLLVELSASFTERVALFVARRDSAVGWKASGFPTAEIRGVRLPTDGGSILALAAAGGEMVCMEERSVAAPVWEALGCDGASVALALPLSVKKRVVAILFCDGSPDSLRTDALAILGRVAEISLGAVALRGRTVSRIGGNVERRPSQEWEPSPPASRMAPAAAPPTPEVPGFEPPAFQAPETTSEATAQPVSQAASEADSGADDPDEEAKRFARLLVSEILLYNEGQIEEGKKNSDLYRRLRDDLDRSEQMYRQRFKPEGDSPDYFQEEVVRTLAAGDPSVLGPR